MTTQVTEIGWTHVPGPHHHDYITEVGGICEKMSFVHNTVRLVQRYVRYEDDRHYPVDKVVGWSQDTVPSMQGCSGELSERRPDRSCITSTAARREA